MKIWLGECGMEFNLYTNKDIVSINNRYSNNPP